MDININKLIENSKEEAEKLIQLTAEIRRTVSVGRPNSSNEATAEGALQAFSIIASKFSPPGYTSEA